jgi:uncharacterized circularly permuted ATP-grasp superfamily protein
MYRVRGTWYDEAFSEDGTARHPYAARARRIGSDPLSPGLAAAEQLRDRPLGDDTRILPVPLILEDDEFRFEIVPGVLQRARALQLLFADVMFEGGVVAAELGIQSALIENITALHGYDLRDLRSWWRACERERIRFTYGPDLVRAPNGRWTVLEDNVGCIGGTADGSVVADRYREVSSTRECRPEPDLSVALRRWLHRVGAGGRPCATAVAVLGCDGTADPWAFQLDENRRRRSVLRELRLPVLGRDAASVRAATAVANFDVEPVWSRLFSGSGSHLLNAPGTDLLGNKALLPHLSAAIRFLLNEEPILATPECRELTRDAAPLDGDDWVVKSAAGRQGTEVVVLRGLSNERRRVVLGRIGLDRPGGCAVAQRYVEPSRLNSDGPGGWNSYRLEMRPIVYVLGWGDVLVADHPVGKAVSSYDDRRLNNVFQGAVYVPVLREPCPWCER